jgi:hypothetical protein
MVALCQAHHDAADARQYSDTELRAMKCRADRQGLPRGDFPARSDRFVIASGGSLFVGKDVLLGAPYGRAVWRSSSNDGRILLNLDLRSAAGKKIFGMVDNEWTVFEQITDMKCQPARNVLSLRAPSERMSLDIRFDRMPFSELHAYLKTKAPLSKAVSKMNPSVDMASPATRIVDRMRATTSDEDDCVVCTLSYDLWFIKATATKLSLPGGITLVGCTFENNADDISIGR